MKRLKKIILYIFYVFCLTGFMNNVSYSQAIDRDFILINQIGFNPKSAKIALIKADVNEFKVLDASTREVVYKGKTDTSQYWKYSGDTVRVADFSSLTKPGKYFISIGDKYPSSYEFSIGTRLYHDIAIASIRAFFLTRCSFELTEKYAGKFKRPLGHPDTAVIIHESAASKSRPAGTIISSPGGWYDAGDYNKYIVNSGISTYTLLLFYQLFPDYCKNLNLSIPESNNDIPDVMDEILYNLKWMLTMQDPTDGGVYHKLTNKEFDSFIMPDKADSPRYVVQKTTATALDFTSVMATAYRIFSSSNNTELKKLAPICLEAAKKAFAWAEANPGILYKQPKDISTGSYGDFNLKDEFFWAKTEMALATNNPSMLTKEEIISLVPNIPSWNKVSMLGIYSLSTTKNEAFKDYKAEAIKQLTGFAKKLNEKYLKSAFRVSNEKFVWGSNSAIANDAMLKIVTYKATGDKSILLSIQGDVDYLLGKNATGYCFVTGFGSKKVMHIHYRPNIANGIDDPYPGFLSGGPNVDVLNDCGNAAKRSKFPAKSFDDSDCSYSTNEIAINWNAPLFFVLGAFDDFD